MMRIVVGIMVRVVMGIVMRVMMRVVALRVVVGSLLINGRRLHLLGHGSDLTLRLLGHQAGNLFDHFVEFAPVEPHAATLRARIDLDA